MFTIHIISFYKEDVVQKIQEKYAGKCIKNIGIVNKIKSIEMAPAKISNAGFLLKIKLQLVLESFMPRLDVVFAARAIKIYDDFILFYPGAGELKNIKIAVPLLPDIEEGVMYDIKLIHFKYSMGNYNCIGNLINY